MIKCEHISVVFGPTPALDDFSFEFPGNGLYCLAGENGAGKSTLLDVLSGFLPWNSGRILILSTGKAASRHWLTRSSARLHQRLVLPLGLKVKNYLCLAGNPESGKWILARKASIPRSGCEPTRLSSIVSILEAGKIDIDAETKMGALSWGQKRLVALTAVVLAPKEMLLLDEPFSAISKDAARKVATLLEMESKRRLVIVAEHNLKPVLDIADECLTLHAGRIIGAS